MALKFGFVLLGIMLHFLSLYMAMRKLNRYLFALFRCFFVRFAGSCDGRRDITVLQIQTLSDDIHRYVLFAACYARDHSGTGEDEVPHNAVSVILSDTKLAATACMLFVIVVVLLLVCSLLLRL